MSTPRHPLPSLEALNERLTLDPATGVLRWRVGVKRRKAGDEAGRIDSSGYRTLVFHGVRYKAHRIVWKMTHHEEPPDYIDHRNDAKTDNRPFNLRASSASSNQANAKTPRTNTSGVKGVCYASRHQAWKAAIRLEGKRVFLGYFKNILHAEKAVVAAREKLHGSFARHI
jgi:hypothetical protein